MSRWPAVPIASICRVDWGNTKLTKRDYVEDGEFLAVSAAGGDGRIGYAEHAASTPVLSAIGANCGRMFLPTEGFTAIKNTITLTPRDGVTTGDFLFHLMQSIQLPIRGAGQPFISKGDIQKFEISLPPLDEQKRIVAKLDEAQRQIDQLTSNLDLQLAAVGYFERAAVNEQIEKGKLTGGGLRSSDLDISSTTEPAVKASQRAPLGTVARIDYGTRVTRKKDGGSKFPVYGGGGATFSLDQSNRESCFIVSRFAMSEECVRYVEGKFFLNDSGLTVSALDETLLTQSYLDHFLLARSIDIFGLGKGTAQRNLDMGAFRSIQIPLPPLDEQKRVVAILGALQQELAALRGRLDKRRSLALSFRDRALAAAFAGDL